VNIHCARRYVSPRTRPLTPEERYTRAIAYALKEPRQYPEIVAVAAQEMADMIRDKPRAILVPIPTSGGDTGPNRMLANAIAERTTGTARVVCALERTRPVESSCARRRRGLAGLAEADHAFRRVGPMLALVPVYFVDNVTTTGATLRAARAAFGFGDALVFADATPNRPERAEGSRRP
jgi:predicted amidophosphoribosyltransferase